MDGFTEMVDAADGFFAGLRANNEKAWFEPRKAAYVARIRKPAELFTEIMAEEVGRITGTSHTGKLFRIYRDVRFSKDKSPYTPWLHILWSAPGVGVPAVFFSCEPGELRLYLGLVGLQGSGLTRFRAFVDAHGDEIAEALDGIGGSLSDFGAAPLKTVPKPYPPDHPHGDLLRRKSLAVGRDLPADWRETGLVAATRTTLERFLPLRRLMVERF